MCKSKLGSVKPWGYFSVAERVPGHTGMKWKPDYHHKYADSLKVLQSPAMHLQEGRLKLLRALRTSLNMFSTASSMSVMDLSHRASVCPGR